MSDEFPFLGLSTPVQEAELPLAKEFAWDFDKDKFIFDGNGNHIIVTGNEAVKVWIYKTLKVERFSYLAYTWNYGAEIKSLIGKVMSRGERVSELKRYITEALLVSPYIKSVESVEIEPTDHGENMNIAITLTTIYGTMTV